jgi:long-chain-fatty-acid---luciferin-component ligase
MYGLVECNMLAIECEHGHKHVPPWVRIVTRRLNKPDEVLPEIHQSGIVSVLDPTSMSYPCFIQTEDVGIITSDGPCSCGRTSQTLKFVRRIDGAELGCCAINLERFMEDGEITRDCKL